ncbi:MAG: YqcC family protein [Nevskia sp.]|nr:YqcC family protein [Nevskia sp.]
MATDPQDISQAAQLEQQADAASSRDLATALYQQAQRLLMPPGVLWSDRAEYEARMLAFNRVQEKLYGVADRFKPAPAADVSSPVKRAGSPAPAEPIDAAPSGAASPPGISATQRNHLAAISRKLDEVEAEMKRIGFWSADPPDLQSQIAHGQIKSYLDAPSFELWLQQVFLPNARKAVAEADLPSQSQVGMMAMRQYDYHSCVPEAQDLTTLLGEFDDLVVSYAG